MKSKPWKHLNIVGQKFGSMTVVKKTEARNGKTYWEVQCDCGQVKEKLGSDLKRAVCCGKKCPHNPLKNPKSHGMSRHPAFAIWSSMKARCYRKTHDAYHNYGARGIKVCDRWLESFENFWEDMGSSYIPGRDLDRVDNNGNYCKENCAWNTRVIGCRNKRVGWVNRLGLPMDFIEQAAAVGINRSTLHYRLKAGVPWEIILKTPVNPTNRFNNDSFPTSRDNLRGFRIHHGPSL